MSNRRLRRKTQRVILRKRAEEAARRRYNQKLAERFIKKAIVKKFHKFILDQISAGTANIIIDIDKIVAGGKAIGKLAWRREYNELVCDKLTQRYPAFEFELPPRSSKIKVTYDRIQNDT